ncbi:hypothetical protein [Desulfonatronovibrio hydrogenovorans]|uniref:hypothetical protein n=1 Tax=Desulfonatronovibrio hydrogenovorans TaxID=53245 RepID=UPI00048DB1F3|nr:hypothetical protein [Desulfonatronovibrio hydrogenovorans]
MDDWVVVAVFDEMNDAVQKEKARIEDIALDVGLMPEKVIRVEDKGKIEILVHPEFYTYYEG